MKTEQMTSVAADLKSKIENKTACVDWGLIALNASVVIDTRNALASCNDIRARLVKA